MKILVTSVGQRGYLLDYFRASMGAGDVVMAADAFEFAPAFGNADRCFTLPRGSDLQFADRLLGLCEQHQVDAVLSINDLELLSLAHLRDRLAIRGTTAIVSSPEVIAVCYDKYLAGVFLAEKGFAVPRTWRTDEVLAGELDGLAGPVIVKPRQGSGSRDVSLLPNARAARLHAEQQAAIDSAASQRFLFQEYVDGKQFSLHIFNDERGRPVRVVVTANLQSHMLGETFHLETVAEPALLELGWRLGEALGHVGPLCVDVHWRDGRWFVLDLNPRFGGGYPAVHLAGGDFTGLIVDMVRGKPLTVDQGLGFKPGVVVLKQYVSYATSREAIGAAVDFSHGPGA